MKTPRVRMVAGPNGSGKSTLVEQLRTGYSVPLGHNLNPDILERDLRDRGALSFSKWDVIVKESELRDFLQNHPLASRSAVPEIVLKNNVLSVKTRLPGGYFAAILSNFLRKRWLAARASFTFETVMSSIDKVELFKEALGLGYRTYLYYVCTNSPRINYDRVTARVSRGGHDVPPQKIGERYNRSLALLPRAIEFSSRAYLFDNSGDSRVQVAEFKDGKMAEVSKTPAAWFVALCEKRLFKI